MNTPAHSTRIEVHVDIEAPAERVLTTITDSAALRSWFAESADISVENLRYDFYGRYTPEDPGRDQAHHPILAFDERRLHYGWRLRGAETQVLMQLTPIDGGTHLDLRHDDAPGRRVEDGSLADWWGLSLENLKAWVERGTVGRRVDFAAPPELELILEVEIAAPGREVFRALIDPAQLERWIGEPGKVVIEPRVGGRLDFGWGDDGGPIRILSMQPDREIAYGWTYAGEPETVVTWSLLPAEQGTKLTLVHQGFVDTILDRPYRTGWTKFVNRVKHLVESGAGWKPARTVAHDYEPAR
jgi:uncharacterized protein YndB with AHSA1/START domain